MLITNAGVTTTYFVGNYYEVVNGVVTKYYYAGSTRIAMRENGTLTYLLSDHLGSTSLVTDASGNLISQQKYKAWGEVRYQSGTNSSEYTYTGQYSYANDFGLMYYGARWYDPSLGRFNQPDTIIPDQYNSLDWDRYTYTRDNPLIYTDPTGHNPVWVLIGLLAAAAVLIDYADNGQVDTLSPDAVTVSYSVTDSTSFLLQYEDDKESPVIAGVDAVFTAEESADFYSSTYEANDPSTYNDNSSVCSPSGSCLEEQFEYIHGSTPNINAGGSVGLVWGQAIKNDIKSYEGPFYNITGSMGPISVTAYTSVDPSNGEANYDVVGLTFGIGTFEIPNVGGYYTNSTYKSNLGGCYTGRAGIKSNACSQ